MKAHTTTVHFTNSYGKNIEARIARDQWGELSVKYLSINDRLYNSKQIKTEWRESVIIDYCRQFVDLEEFFADSIADEQETRHCID